MTQLNKHYDSHRMNGLHLDLGLSLPTEVMEPKASNTRKGSRNEGEWG